MLPGDRNTTINVDDSAAINPYDDDEYNTDSDAYDEAADIAGYLNGNASVLNPAVCRSCKLYAPPRSFHCVYCQTCIVRKDHHSVLLDCCIGQHNYRLYFVGGMFGMAALVMAANLALTSICHPFKVGHVFGVVVFLPDDCSEVYDQWE